MTDADYQGGQGRCSRRPCCWFHGSVAIAPRCQRRQPQAVP